MPLASKVDIVCKLKDNRVLTFCVLGDITSAEQKFLSSEMMDVAAKLSIALDKGEPNDGQ